MIPDESIVKRTRDRYASRAPERERTERTLSTGGTPLAADSPERVNKRLSHIELSEMARATALPAEGATHGEVNVLERIIGTNDLMSVTFLDLAVTVARTVGRVRIRSAAGQLVGYGTGFLIGPRVLMTNNHVLGAPDQAVRSEIEFNYQDTISGLAPVPVVFGLDPASLFLTDRELDYTAVAVRPRSGATDLASFGYNRLMEEEGKVLIGEYLNII